MEEKRKLTLKEKLGVSAAIMMFFAIGMMMGGGKAGNMPLTYSGAGLFVLGAIIAVWLIVTSKDRDDDEDFFEG